jgi:hypothetical protein
MRQRMVRPRIAALHADRLAGVGFGLVQPIALLQPERMHAPGVVVFGVGGGQVLADAQQRFGVAHVEGMQLPELAGEQIARPLGDHLLVQRQGPVAIAVDPGLRCVDPGLLARADAPGHRHGARQMALSERAALRRVHRQHEIGRHHRQQRAFLFGVGGGDEAVQMLAEDQPFLAQEVERLYGVCIGVGDLQSLTVPHHELRFSLAELRMAWHRCAKCGEDK